MPAALSTDGIIVYDGPAGTYLDGRGLINGKTYYYAIFTYDSLRNYSRKDWTKATPVMGTGIAPSAPSGLTVSLSSKDLSFIWTDNFSDEDWFVIEQQESAGEWVAVAYPDAGQTGLTVQRDDPNFALKPSTPYQYRIKAVNAFGLSGYVYGTGITTPAFPAAPTGLAWKIISAGRVNLSWNKEALDVTGYRIELCKNNPEKTIVKSLDLLPNASSASVTGLTPGTEYLLKVVVIKGIEETAIWTDVIVTTPDDKGGVL